MKNIKILMFIFVLTIFNSCIPSYYTKEFIVIKKTKSETPGYFRYKLKNYNTNKHRTQIEFGYHSFLRDSIDYPVGHILLLN
jgi:ABC-type uncharacterized transport system fused permease/ATPase subunit